MLSYLVIWVWKDVLNTCNKRGLTAIEGLEERLGLWLRRMSTAPTTSESMATSKASVAFQKNNFRKKRGKKPKKQAEWKKD